MAADDVHAFLGIPFARPPVGHLRFKAPLPPESWRGVRSADSFRAAAPQPELPVDPGLEISVPGLGAPQSEDCLYLNVWTPAVDHARRPVMVWIHGGNFTMGSGAQADPTPLVRAHDVVVVAINYRLGALGFLYLNELLGDDVVANPGLLDQAAALRWVRDNVAALGGDPDNVTLFGVSAGAFSIGALLGTPAAAGLFHRAILQSGAAHAGHSPAVGTRVAEGVLAELGVSARKANVLLDVPTQTLLEAQEAYYSLQRALTRRQGYATADPTPTPVWAPAYQPVIDGAVVPRRGIDAVQAGACAALALLVGCTLEEQKLSEAMDPEAPTTRESLLAYANELLLGDAAARDSRAEAVVSRYEADAPHAEPARIYSAIETDRIFRIPALRLAEAQSRYSPASYAYVFAKSSPIPAIGAGHGVDIPYLFDQIGAPHLAAFAADVPESQHLGRQMRAAWTSFARHGDPRHEMLPEWPPFSSADPATMLFDTPCAVVRDHLVARNRAWKDLL